jgi:phage terminase large subunit-like protein
VRALFGSYDETNKTRHLREIFALVPKKNSKTSYGAALMLTALVMNKRPRAEFLLIGPTQAIADLAFTQAIGMVQAEFDDEKVRKSFWIREHLKEIRYRPSGARLKIKTFAANVLTGTKPAGILIDELHVISALPDAAGLIGQLRGGLLSQPESFMVFISTQSEKPPAGVFRAELMKARAIRDGKVTADMLPVLYEFPDDIALAGEWRNPKYWHMVNPNFNRSITIERLIEDFEGAKAAGDQEVRRWASQHLNIEIGLALRSDRWVGADFWEECADRTLTLDTLIERSEVLVSGIDGGGLDDLLGVGVMGREKGTGRWLLWSHCWAYEIALERRKSEAARLRDFVRDGDLTIVNQLGDDVEQIGDLVERLMKTKKLAEHAVGVDPHGIGQIVEELEQRGLKPERIAGVPQGWQLNGPIKTAERKLAQKALVHNGGKMMSWCMSNAKIEIRGSAVSINKAVSGRAKIDPVIAMLNAAALMSKNPTSNASVYETRDRLIIVGF